MSWRPPYQVDILKIYENQFDTAVNMVVAENTTTDGVYGVENDELYIRVGTTTGRIILYSDTPLKGARIIIETKITAIGRWVGIGLTNSDASKRIFVIYDNINGVKKIEYHDTTGDYALTSITETITLPVFIRFIVTGNKIVVLESADGITWTKKLEADCSTYINLFDSTVISTMFIGIGGGVDTTYTENRFDYLTAHYFTGYGARDPSPVRSYTGRLYIYNNKYYMTVTAGGYAIHGSCTILIEATDINDPTTWTVKGIIFTKETITGSEIINFDHPIRIIMDPANNRAILGVPRRDDTGTLQSAGILIMDIQTIIDWFSNGGVLVIDTANIIDLGEKATDVDIIYNTDTGKYYVVYSSKVTYGLKVFETTDFTSFNLIAQLDGISLQIEGSIFEYVKDEGIRIFAVKYNGVTGEWQKYDIQLNLIATYPVDTNIFRYSSWFVGLLNGKAVGFNNNLAYDIPYSHGDLIVFDADPAFYTTTEVSTGNFIITKYPETITGNPNSTKMVSITIRNNGDITGTIECRIIDHNGSIVTGERKTIEPYSEQVFSLWITIPPQEGVYKWKIEAYNVENGTIDDTKDITIISEAKKKKKEFPWWLIGIGLGLLALALRKNR